jgi:hypothetical protein
MSNSLRNELLAHKDLGGDILLPDNRVVTRLLGPSCPLIDLFSLGHRLQKV